MSSVRKVTPPNLPVAPPRYEQRFFDQLLNIMRLFFNSAVNELNAPVPHGSFYDTTDQTNDNTTNLVRVDTTAAAYDIYRGQPTSRIYVNRTGIYNIQFSLQVDKTDGGADEIYIWLRKNGGEVAHSASKVVLDGPNSAQIPAWNFVIQLSAGDYIELAWNSPDATMFLSSPASTATLPAIPSVILTVVWVSGL